MKEQKKFGIGAMFHRRNNMKKVEKYLTEGKFKKGYYVVLHGKGGELDRVFVANRRGIKAVLIDWSNDLDAGDMIKIEKGESEI